MKSLGEQLYLGPDGRYWARPTLHGRRTWRLLKATKERAARIEVRSSTFTASPDTFTSLSTLYEDAGCPNRRLEARLAGFTGAEKARLVQLRSFFGAMRSDEIRLVHLPSYKKWRVRSLRQGTGERTVDKDLCTLSNVLSYGVAIGALEINFVRSGRPKYRHKEMVRHSREVAPASADTVHALAGALFSNVRSEVLGWQLLFGMLTGCRTSELLRLRTDAAGEDDPGFYRPGAPGFLFLGRRSKGGVNPWALVGPEFAAMLECFHRWHRIRHRKSPLYFPGRRYSAPVSLGALGHALTRLCLALRLPKITPHGLRSFYVTKRRSDGESDTVIAGEIGDKTVALMQSTYGSRPKNWSGGVALGWLPSEGFPAWDRWQEEKEKVIALSNP